MLQVIWIFTTPIIYRQVINWYNIDSILTDEELQKIQEDVYDELGITETTE